MLFALLRGFRRSTEANPFVIDIPDRTGIWLVARLLALHLLRNVKKCEIYFRIKHKKLDLNGLLWRQKNEPCGSFLLSYKHLKLQDGIAECPEHTV